MKNEFLHGALAENVLTLLCFFDDAAALIKNSVSPDLFESSVFQNIARASIEYHDSYKQAPKEHLPDILENSIKNEDESLLKLYDQTFRNLFDASESLNPDYILTQLGNFIEQQQLKLGTVEAMKLLQTGDTDGAKVVLTKSLKQDYDIFDPGLFINKAEDSFRFFNSKRAESLVKTGIPELDAFDICPSPGEMYLILALANRGKTWFMIHLGKKAMMQRLKVVHITLEMNPDKIMQRYMQSIFSISKRKAKTMIASLEKDEYGKIINIEYDSVLRPSLEDRKIKQILSKKHKKLLLNKHLVVKQFPPRTLTVKGLEAYLDSLQRVHKFMPDVVILDYADDMYVDAHNFRIATGNLYKELRGSAVERNYSLITASQANRNAERAKIITMENFSEDFSKAHTADIVISYNQTQYEKELGLARLFTAKVRDDASSKLTLISQNYQNGQFCLDSAKMDTSYWDLLKPDENNDEPPDDIDE